MRFGEFLVVGGVIAEADLAQALARQEQAQHSMARVALDHQLMEANKLFEILKLQKHRTGLRQDHNDDYLFQALAMQRGYLDRAGLDQILTIQQQSRPRIGEILVAMGCLTRGRMEAELCAHDGYRAVEVA